MYGPFHLGDEYIRGWAPLSGACQSLAFESTHRWPPVTITFESYGAERVSIDVNGYTYHSRFSQPVQPNRKRPNYWSKPNTIKVARMHVARGKNMLRLCALPMPVPDGQKEDLDDFMLRNVLVSTLEAESGEILPISNKRILVEDDIQGLNPLALKFARNEIFARHGYPFKSRELRDHFGALSWYRPISHNVTLSDIESQNVAFLRRYESEPGLAARLVSTAHQPLTAASTKTSTIDSTVDRSLETVTAYATSEAAKRYLEDVKSFQAGHPGVLDAFILSRLFLSLIHI